MEKTRVISVNPAEATLGVRTGVENLVPRISVVDARYDISTGSPDFLHSFLFPVKNISTSTGIFCLALRGVISILLLGAGICVIFNLPQVLSEILAPVSGITSGTMPVETSPLWGIMEIACAIFICIGLFTRPIAILTAIMLGLLSAHLSGWHQILASVMSGLSCLLALLGPGRISADLLLHLLLKNKSK